MEGGDAGAEVALTGRFDDADPGGPRFAWSGSTVTARFRGGAVDVDLVESSADQRYAIVVDGQLRPGKLAPAAGRHRYRLADALGDGAHEVSLYRLTEAALGETQLAGVRVDDRALPVGGGSPRARQVELIGDSISAGYGDEGRDRDCPFSPDTENHYLTYGAIAARHLDADLVTVAWSGKGVFSNRGSTVDTVPMPALWLRALPERADSRWDFARYRPDAVVINLGTNDLADENPDWSPLPAAYLAFVRDVRARYPDAEILCGLGPMLSDDWPEGRRARSTARDAIQGAIAALAAAGDARIHLVEFPVQDGSTGYGCDWHPSLATHERMAAQLEAALRAHLGW